MATNPNRTYAPGSEYFGHSGFPDVVPSGAYAYAQRLVQYISDPSTVRARTLDEYGKAPPVATIRGWRDNHVAVLEARRAARAPDADLDWCDDDTIDLAIAERLAVETTAATVSFNASCGESAAEGANDASDDEDHVVSETRRQALTSAEVIQACAARCGVSAEDMVGPSRKTHIVKARQFAATVLRARGNSYPAIGRFIGDRDHSTMMYSVGAFFAVAKRDPFYISAWMSEAPCVAKIARTAAELELLTVVRQ